MTGSMNYSVRKRLRMKVSSSVTLPNGLGLSIIEVDNPVAVQHFDARFQICLEINNVRVLPKSKNKFCKFKKTNYIYALNGIMVDEILWYEKHICDRTSEECTTELLNYLSMYNQGIDIKRELRKTYNF